VKNRKSKQEGKSSVAAGAVEDNEEEIIPTAVKDENQYMYLDDKKMSEDKESIVEDVYTSNMQTVTLLMRIISVQSWAATNILMKRNLRRSFLGTRMNMLSSSTGIMTMMTVTTKDASQALGLFGTHKCKLTTSKSQVLTQRQTSASAPSILVT
jgi:hypothetical protein